MGTVKPDFTPKEPNCIIKSKIEQFKAYICDQTGTVWDIESGYKFLNKWSSPFWFSYCRAPLEREGQNVADAVNHPEHYNQDGIECIDAIRASLGPDGFEAYCKGNCMKYLWRYKYKNGLEDLKKAQVYLGWMIETVEKGGSDE